MSKNYDALVENARSRAGTTIPAPYGKEGQAAETIAFALNGLTYAVLALAESNRPEPVQVEVKVNAEEVATAVSESLTKTKES